MSPLGTKQGTVYRAHCLVTDKSYIGITSQKFKYRRQAHRENAKNPDARTGARSAFYEAIREHGWSSFRWYVVARAATMEELLTLEAEAIEKYNTIIPNGYNLDSSRARPVRDDNTGIVYASIREASRETHTGHQHIASSADTGLPLASGKKFSWFETDLETDEKDEK